MTIQQLQYVLEVSRTGSISKAARNLFLSQPNISNSIKNLEQELGATLFIRTSQGMSLTEAGEHLVQHAGVIINELNALSSVVQTSPSYYFRLSYPRYIPSFEAFCDLCRRYQDRPELQLSCFYNSTPDVLTSVLKNQCDLCICIEQSGTSLRNRCRAANISYTVLAHIPLCVQLSRSHPLLQEPDFDFAKLADYPFTVFSDPDSPSVTQYTFPFINANKLIRVHSSTSRRDIVAHTTAFNIVLQHSQEYNDRYGLVNIPLPDFVCELAYLHSATRTLPPLALEYLELLKERLAFLDPLKNDF